MQAQAYPAVACWGRAALNTTWFVREAGATWKKSGLRMAELCLAREGLKHMYAYCLFCQTQKCKTVALCLEQKGMLRAFSPQIIRRHRIKGKNVDALYDLLPGYVFAFSETELQSFEPFRGIDGVIRRLGMKDNRYALTGSDLDFAMNLYRKDGTVGQITVFKKGDIVRLDDPLFNGCKGEITQIDYRKQRARVAYQFIGMQCFTWIACELISKQEESKQEKQ